MAVSIKNAGSVTFGPQFKTKKEAEELLSKIKKQCLFGFDEAFAFMRLIVQKIYLKVKDGELSEVIQCLKKHKI